MCKQGLTVNCSRNFTLRSCLLAVCMFLMTGCGSLQAKESIVPHNPDTADKEIGSISYKITDVETQSVIAETTMPLRVKDVQIKMLSGIIAGQFKKELLLADPFYIAIHEQGDEREEDLIGFALTAERTDMPTFSWEWFDIEGPDRATKIQGLNNLRIRKAKVGSAWEVVETEFLEDVNLRVSKFGQINADKPDWLITIRKGSIIRWPSAVNGKVTLD